MVKDRRAQEKGETGEKKVGLKEEDHLKPGEERESLRWLERT